MSSRIDPAKTPAASAREPRERGKPRTAAPAPSGAGGRFDKAFPVWLEGERGVASGIARNVTETGMFVETREPFPLSSRVRVTFVSPSRARTEMTLEAEVRYQCFINFARPDETRAGMRGIGLKFVANGKGDGRKGSLH